MTESECPALGTAGESMRPCLVLNTTSRGKILLGLGRVNRRELLELCMCPVKRLGTR